MNVRESVPQLVDELSEDRLGDALDYLADRNDRDETLSAGAQAAVEKGLTDLENGRTISLKEYRRARSL